MISPESDIIFYECSEGCKITMTASSVVKDLRFCFSRKPVCVCVPSRAQSSSFSFIIIYNHLSLSHHLKNNKWYKYSNDKLDEWLIIND